MDYKILCKSMTIVLQNSAKAILKLYVIDYLLIEFIFRVLLMRND